LAASNNLNRIKSKELVFYAQRARFNASQPPPLCQGIKQVESLTALGVTVNNRLLAAEHVTNILLLCSGLLTLFGSYKHTTCVLPCCTTFFVLQSLLTSMLWILFCCRHKLTRCVP